MLYLTSRLRPANAATRHARKLAPRCRGGASSLLRLAQPAAPRLPSTFDLSEWIGRAASVLQVPTASVFAPSEFSPS